MRNAAKTKRKTIPGRDPISQLYRAVRRYIESNGGAIVVIGGIQVQQFPGDTERQFTIGVKCLGRKPEFSAPEQSGNLNTKGESPGKQT